VAEVAHGSLVVPDGADRADDRVALNDALHRQEHFEDLEQQAHASHLGMWVFLASEVLFFGVLFTLYAGYRAAFPHQFALAARHSDLLLGTINTYLLLIASFLVATSLAAIKLDRGRLAALLLWGAALLGVVFLAIKLLEYSHHFAEGIYPGRYYTLAELPGRGPMAFFTLYYVTTGLHFLHVAGGVLLLSWIGWRARRGDFDAVWHTPLELSGMYWHFVDLVWLFVWPCFYLLR
jgi:cytochrome c oxidase subunit III